MRAMNSPGMWHLPDNTGGNVAGTLQYSIQGGLILSLTGAFSDDLSSKESDTYPIIHGVISDSPYDGRLVTLVDCFRKRVTFAVPGFASEEIRANRAYIGTRHLATEEDAHFVSFRATYAHLPEWSGLSGFRQLVRQDEQSGVLNLPYERPSPLDFRVSDTSRARIEVNVVTSQGHRRFELNEQVQLTSFDAAGFAPLLALKTLVSPFQDLLTFAVDTPSTLNDITFTASPTGDKRGGDSVNLVFQPVYQPGGEGPPLSPADMLFSWSDIAATHPDVIQTWLKLRSDFKAPYDIYFGLAYGPPAYIETKFLLLVTALSLFLAGRVPDQEIRDAIESLRRAASDSRERLWVDMIPNAEELSLPRAVSSLIQDHRELLLPAVGNDIERFLAEFVDVKLHLFGPENGSDTRRGMQGRLLRTMERLSLLTKVHILQSLGFSQAEILALVSDTRRYRSLLRD